jgi:hypothetical protein
VENLAGLDAATEQFVPCRLDVGDDQVQALSRARARRRDVVAEDHRAPGAGRRELDPAPVATSGEISVESPPEPCVKLLRAVDIRDGDDNHFELLVDFCGVRVADCFVTADFVHQSCHAVFSYVFTQIQGQIG